MSKLYNKGKDITLLSIEDLCMWKFLYPDSNETLLNNKGIGLKQNSNICVIKLNNKYIVLKSIYTNEDTVKKIVESGIKIGKTKKVTSTVYNPLTMQLTTISNYSCENLLWYNEGNINLRQFYNLKKHKVLIAIRNSCIKKVKADFGLYPNRFHHIIQKYLNELRKTNKYYPKFDELKQIEDNLMNGIKELYIELKKEVFKSENIQ